MRAQAKLTQHWKPEADEDVAPSNRTAATGRPGRPGWRRHRTTRNKDEARGTPQGARLSPLLANVYMRRFTLGWKVLGCRARFDAHIVNYADNFVICCRGSAEQAMAAMWQMMAALC